ncbi:MAG: SusC/RagA family TonB-linked outer membrane protein [Dysgonomonas sp.]
MNVYLKERKIGKSVFKVLLLCGILLCSHVFAQAQTVTGIVKDRYDEPIIGASVAVKGTTNGTLTDTDGKYSISSTGANSVLVFSFVGYKSQEVPVASQSVINVTLQDSDQQLDEVVVTALGIRKESKKLGYAISTISANELTKAAAPNLGSALYGKASGVRIQTAPGGIAGAITINVRGLNSITGTNQPLIVMDGVPIHNGDANLDGYWTNQRIQSNGLADINPEDIESISVLKGASASALYGSEAANGVVIITTKSGKGTTGVGVDFSASLTFDPISYMPKYQTKYGPGVQVSARTDANGLNAEGWRTNGWDDRNGVNHRRGSSTTRYWGPKYDGQDVLYYDGTVRKYSPINDNPWSEIFRTGITQQYNLAVTNATEKSNFRFSYTYVDNKPTQYNSTYQKHNFNLTGNYNITKNIKLGYGVNYMLQDQKNPPYRISRITNNITGMAGPFDDVKYLREHTKTSMGYLNQAYTETNHLTPDEGFEWKPAPYDMVSEYFWNVLGKEYLTNNNRLIANVAPSWEIIKGLTLSGRLATDYTTEKIEKKEQVEQSIVFDPNRGYYGLENKRYEIFYGDVMLTYDTNLTDKLGLGATVGWQGRTEREFNSSVGTTGGLSVENWFHLNASNGVKSAEMTKREFLKTAFLGSLSLSYDSWAYLEGTARQEKISTLAPGNNSFFYPSVNGSIIYTELFRDKMPSWYDYGKIRASYGIVGNAPPIYKGTQGYVQNTAGGEWIYNTVDKEVGNVDLRPEKKFEWEFGLESKFLNNRLGFEISYYTNRIEDQILNTTMPTSSGAKSIWLNVGELKNQGLELSLYGTPVQTRDFTWELRGNLAWNKNKVTKLADGIDQLEHKNWDNGSAYLYSKVGRPMGEIYALTPKQDENGNYIIREDGFYQLTDEPVKVGNAMPKVIGGFATTFNYKNFALDMSFDFRIGGAVMNVPYQYMMGQGAIEESLKYHDGEGWGKTFYFDANRNVVPFTGSVGPNGERIYDNGVVLKGVKADGSENTTMIPGDLLAYYTYNWGGYDPTDVTYYSHSIFDNTYVKCRELSLSYNLPQSVLSKIKCKSLQLSVFGRNLFYLYKNLPMLDAEAADGTTWITQTDIGGSTATTRSIGVALRASF